MAEVAVGMLQHATGTRHTKMPVPRPQDGQAQTERQMERQTGLWGRGREGRTVGQTETDSLSKSESSFGKSRRAEQKKEETQRELRVSLSQRAGFIT